MNFAPKNEAIVRPYEAINLEFFSMFLRPQVCRLGIRTLRVSCWSPTCHREASNMPMELPGTGRMVQPKTKGGENCHQNCGQLLPVWRQCPTSARQATWLPATSVIRFTLFLALSVCLCVCLSAYLSCPKTRWVLRVTCCLQEKRKPRILFLELPPASKKMLVSSLPLKHDQKPCLLGGSVYF